MQQGVQKQQVNWPLYKDINRSSKEAAIPNLTSALFVNNTVRPLMSLCMTWFLWRWLTPCTNACTMKRKVRFQKTNLNLVKKLFLLRARKIVEFYLSRWTSNPQILLAPDTSPLAWLFKLINNSWTQNGSQTTGMLECNKPIWTVALLVLITFTLTPLYCNTSTTFNLFIPLFMKFYGL